ncbi:ATP-dependent RNA helicase Sum3 [Phlyctochytrium arcticum]|nr:ATP-dependent RNA helicase Sum3 [Phlyctochytrium arcticum]
MSWDNGAAEDTNGGDSWGAGGGGDAWGAGGDAAPADDTTEQTPAPAWGGGGGGGFQPAAPVIDERVKKYGEKGEELPEVAFEDRQWFGMAKRWEDGEADPMLEKELYEENRVQSGAAFDRLNECEVKTSGEDKPDKLTSFAEANLAPELMHNIIDLMKYEKPTPIQAEAIPILCSGRDLMATAQTGSGKTASYIIPMLNNMLKLGKDKIRKAAEGESFFKKKIEPAMVVILPTRELAAQTFDECRKFAYKTWIRPGVIYGGADSKKLMGELERGCDILSATPGILLNMLEQGRISFKKVKFLVIDEADRLFELGFEEVVRRIVHGFDMPHDESRQTALLSATFPKAIRSLAKEFLLDCVMVNVGKVGTVPKDIVQKIEKVEQFDKRAKLLDVLYEQEPGLTLIFVNTCRAVDTLDEYLYTHEFPVTSVHSGRTQGEREDSISAFKARRKVLMVATDLAARGLDIPNVVHVINYDMPQNMEDYIHRIGRTARVGNQGLATSFFTEENSEFAAPLIKILKSVGQEVPEFLVEMAAANNMDDGEASEKDDGEVLDIEDLDADLPEGYIPLGEARPDVGGDDAGGGGAWGAGGGDAWGGGGDADEGGFGGGDAGFGEAEPSSNGGGW